MISELRRWEQHTEQVDQPALLKSVSAHKDETVTTGLLLVVSSTNRARRQTPTNNESDEAYSSLKGKEKERGLILLPWERSSEGTRQGSASRET